MTEMAETGHMTGKHELRAAVRRARAERSTACGQELRATAFAAEPVQALLQAASSGRRPVVAAYAAMAGEPDVGPLRQSLRAAGVQVLLPVVCRGRDGAPALAWAADDGALRRGQALPGGLLIDEPTGPAAHDPSAAALMLLPALAVDLSGTRLGQGAGYYDRALHVMRLHAMALSTRASRGTGRAAPLLVAVVHDEEVLEHGRIPRQEHDQPVQVALTPSRWLVLG